MMADRSLEFLPRSTDEFISTSSTCPEISQARLAEVSVQSPSDDAISSIDLVCVVAIYAYTDIVISFIDAIPANARPFPDDVVNPSWHECLPAE
jgi:hypothetical protein